MIGIISGIVAAAITAGEIVEAATVAAAVATAATATATAVKTVKGAVALSEGSKKRKNQPGSPKKVARLSLS